MIERRVADGSEQHGVRALTGSEGRRRQRGESLTERSAAYRIRLERQLAPESARDGFEHEPGRGHDLGADAVAGQQNDRVTHGDSRKRR